MGNDGQRYLVLSRKSLQFILEYFSGLDFDVRYERLNEWLSAPDSIGEIDTVVATGDEACSTFSFVAANDENDESRAAVPVTKRGTFNGAPGDASLQILKRIHRALCQAVSPPISLPNQWNGYHDDDLIAFFAAPEDVGDFRWVAQVWDEGGTNNLFFWEMTTGQEKIDLAEYSPDPRVAKSILDFWRQSFKECKDRLNESGYTDRVTALQDSVDLDETSFGAVTRYRTYNDWLTELTQAQQRFLDSSAEKGLKLRGAAGTGKTLCLELKALKLAYQAAEDGGDVKIAFITHSWAVAQQVDEALNTMDVRGEADRVEVLPLLALARIKTPSERKLENVKLLGEDSLDGRRKQLEKISEVLKRVRQGDWLAYRSRVSDSFRERVKSDSDSARFWGFVWDLMNEFSSVISAHGILPGIGAEDRYIQLERADWMMPLTNEAEKRFVYKLFVEYLEELKDEGYVTSDQIINDFISYLETYSWNFARSQEGYDYIFVDELHLFSDQERLALHYLTKDPNEYPKMVLALDPRQSPVEVYAEIPNEAEEHRNAEGVDTSFEEAESLDLSTVHRFTPEILSFVKHIHGSYPALDLGDDWELDLQSLNTFEEEGERPSIVIHGNYEEEWKAVGEDVSEIEGTLEGGERFAVIALNASELDDLASYLEESEEANVSVLRSRDDVVQKLQYTRRTVIVTSPRYVAGLQFHTVVICGFPNDVDGGHQRRRFLSNLYLAVSRAKKTVRMHANTLGGELPEILETGVQKGIIERS